MAGESASLWRSIDLYDDIGRIFMDLHNEALSPAIQALEESVDPSALSDFCWHLCKDWLEVDAPAKQMWVFDTFLRFGAEELVEHLPKIIDFWIGSKLHQRGRKVLEALEPNDNPYLYEALDAMRHGGYSDGAKLSEARLNAFCSEHFAARGEDASSLQIDDFLDAHTSTHGLDTSRRLSLDTTSHVEVRLDADLEPHLVSPPGEPIALDPTATLRWELLKKRL